MQEKLNLLDDLIRRARAAGADAADAVFVEGKSVSVTYRKGKVEHLERSEGQDLGLRVLIAKDEGGKPGMAQAIVSTSDTRADELDAFVARAVAMAKAAPADPYAGIAEPGQLATDFPDLDMFDASEPTTKALTEQARVMEEAGVAVAGVTQPEGADAGFSQSRVAIAASNGFAQTYARSSHSLSASMIAGEGDKMERDWDYSGSVWAEDLRNPADIGRTAGERAVKRLNPRKVKSAQVPVIFEARVARSLIGHLSSAINGSSIARGTSFLKDAMDTEVFGPGINIIDDPLRKRGLRSGAFDDEGVAAQRRNVIDQGRLTTWFLDLRSARQLGLRSTGHASRGVSTPPSPSSSNLYLEPGPDSLEAMIKAAGTGFFVTELIGMGVNTVTGDYSRGASGFWIENGELAYPVSELTVAGNLKDMFRALEPANDLVFRYGVDSPSVRIGGLTVAGI